MHGVGEGNYCSYMKCTCTDDCEHAYEHRHGSAGYTCMREGTELESIMSDIKVAKYEIDNAKEKLYKAKEKLHEAEERLSKYKAQHGDKDYELEDN